MDEALSKLLGEHAATASADEACSESGLLRKKRFPVTWKPFWIALQRDSRRLLLSAQAAEIICDDCVVDGLIFC